MLESMFASNNLYGKVIDGWRVIQKLDSPDISKGETGGNFSVCYIVEKDGNECFMKVLDYKKCMTEPLPTGVLRAAYVAQSTSEFNYEMILSQRCLNRKISNVIKYITGGECDLPEFDFPTVSYIIYEKADGNIRKTLDLSRKLVFREKLKDLTFKLKSLHEISIGVRQLHENDLSHQDIKPSNILTVDDTTKLGDLGRALCFDPSVKCPYPIDSFNGDWTYAPPESFFGFRLPEVKERLYQMDNYMVGSLVVYYITGVSMNVMLERHLPEKLFIMARSGMSFESAKAYLTNAFQNALLDFEKDIPFDDIKEGLVSIVSYLCEPDPEHRGHPKIIGDKSLTPNYDLQRTISELDLLLKKTELGLIKK